MKRQIAFWGAVVIVSVAGCGRWAIDDLGQPPGHDAGGSAGACLLSYNDALVSGDPCCYRQGGANTCDETIACNAQSGSGCCLIYGTEATAGGQRCCLYDGGQYGDDAAECRTLLATAR